MPNDTNTKIVLATAAYYVRNGWSQGEYARDRHGEPCSQLDRQATSFCAVGALDRAAYESNLPLTNAVAAACRALPFPTGLSAWNDDIRRQPGEVAALLQKAANS